MIIRNLRALAFLAIAATFAVAGCGGGGSKSLPMMPQGQLGSKVGVTFTFRIGGSSSQSGSQRTPKYLPTTTQSIVIEYIGDNPSATPTPGSTPGTTAVTAATVNVTTSGTNPPPAGSCFNNAGSFICTVSVQLPVGVLDLYILAFDGQNGTGNLIASTVTIVQVAQSGALTNPGTTTPVSIVLGANPTSVAFNTLSAIVPNGVPNPAVTPASYPSPAPPYVYSAAGTMNLGGVPANTTINSVVLTDNDTSGNTCLVYIPAGATSATPCPMSTAKSSITLSNSSDSYAVLYNGKFLPGGTFTISATGASSPLTVNITPTIFAVGTANLAGADMGPIGAVLYDATAKTMYVGMGNQSTPLYTVSYSSTTGYGAATAVNVTSLNGSAATHLTGVGGGNVTGGPNAMVIGPDNNIWMVENNSRPGGAAYPQYVAVAAIHSAVVNPLDGSTIAPGPGVFAEYTVQSTAGVRGNYTAPLHGIVSLGGYIWIVSKDGMLWRINPTTGLLSPNLAAGYLPGGTITQSSPLTDPGNTTLIYGAAGSRQAILYSTVAALGGTLYVGNDHFSSIDAISLDTSASPSAGICTTAGPPPCIGTFQNLLNGLVPGQTRGGGTDGTSLYVLDSSNGRVLQFTPPSTLTTSTGAFTSYDGTIGVSPDGWLWTLTGTGVQGLAGMSSSASPVAPPAVTACNSNSDVERAATAWIAGPDGTWLFTPNTSGSSSTTPAVLCAVVY